MGAWNAGCLRLNAMVTFMSLFTSDRERQICERPEESVPNDDGPIRRWFRANCASLSCKTIATALLGSSYVFWKHKAFGSTSAA